MFRKRVFVLLILALLALAVVGPVSAAADQHTPYQATMESVTAYSISGNAGVAGAVLKYTDGTAKTATANSSGVYSFIVPSGWSGTVTPTRNGYIFSPTSRSYTSVAVDKTGQNYVATALTKTPTPGNSPTATKVPFAKYFPGNGSTNVSRSVTLKWTAYDSPTTDKYRYCIDTSNNNICDATGGYTSAYGLSVTLSNLALGTTYYWHVQAITCINCVPKKVQDSNGGVWWSFTTVSATVTPTRTLTRTPTRTPTRTSTRTPTPAPVTVNFLSTGADDGWILESTETSGTGGTINAIDPTFTLGDNASNRQFRAILSFDTSSLPDTAVITYVVLKIKQSGVAGTNPFTILGALKVDIRQGTFGAQSLELTDFNAAASALNVATFGTTPVNYLYSAAFNGTGNAKVNRIGVTQLRLYFTLDDNNNHVGDYMKFLSGDSATNKPLLTITYH